jgi:hypothetical protein
MGILPAFLADSSRRVILDTTQHIGFGREFRLAPAWIKHEN